ncbi:MAG: hypothetical protein B5M54_11065 [Candidatus Aminicenantes bacterium 4484_214]|nr:MAG: hypothetical protein B5M54_11065 [Candidatus Aminicenantes bacterium 4484_214]
MGFTRWGYYFYGPFSDLDELSDAPGVYVLLCEIGKNILDVGESENVRARVKNHERSDCWRENCFGAIIYSVTYILDEEERRELEKRIRESERVACGER